MSKEPITKKNLLSALEHGRLHRDQRKSPSWWVEQITEYKVDFQLTDADEKKIRRTGEYLGKQGLTDLVKAIRKSFAKEPDYVGTLDPNTPIDLRISGIPALEIGDSGAVFYFGGEGVLLPILMQYGCRITIESIGGEIKISTQIRDWHGDMVAELTRNEWKVSPTTWDRNYTKNSLEVKDATGLIVLQVRVLADRIQLQGEWWASNGKGIRLVTSRDPRIGDAGGLFVHLTNQQDRTDQPTIEPIFQYPSKLHFGELRKH